MLTRSSEKVEIELKDEVETWSIIKTNDFSSERKMMSVVARCDTDDRIMSYVKGADMAVYMKV